MSLISKLWLLGSVVAYSCLYPHQTNAQVIPDGTTPTTNVVGNCLAKCSITGGIQADRNLFHSFREFNVGIQESIYFANPGVANIFSRVTGNNSSQIFGILGVTGDANLWLLNPQGILFGNGATLDINGSFIATTADEIIFGDRGIFAAKPDSLENLPLLTVNPDAFFYHQMEQTHPIVIQNSSLEVPVRENIVLLGGQNQESSSAVLLENSSVKASQGNIQIGAVSDSGTVEIDPNLQLKFPQNIAQGNITLAQDSSIDVSGIGGGNVTVQGAKLNIIESSNILSVTLGNIDSGDIRIVTEQLNIDKGIIHSLSFGAGKSADIIIQTQSLNIAGEGLVSFQQFLNQGLTGSLRAGVEVSGIAISADDSGAAGNMIIESNNVSIVDGGFIANVIYSEAQGGNIEITATEEVKLDASGMISLSAIDSSGNTGDIAIATQKLSVQNGSIISAATLGKGTGGEITINAAESVDLSKTPAMAILPTAIFTNSVFPNSGNAGTLAINTKRLTITDGSQISSASGVLTNRGIIPFGGMGGDIKIDATESVTVSGASTNGIFPSGIVSDTKSNNPAGNITINTGAFSLNGQALVSASSISTGDGGNLTINAAKSIQLSGEGGTNLLGIAQSSLSPEELDLAGIRGGLFTIGVAGNAKNINLTTPVLNLDNGSLISSAALGLGNAGSINIKTSQTTEIKNSIISSTALDRGDAGDIMVDTNYLRIGNGGTIVTASLGFGAAGKLTINATESIELANDESYTNSLFVPGGIITSKIGRGSTGAGNLQINTKNLTITDGLEINVANNLLTPSLTETPSSNVPPSDNNLPQNIGFKPGNSAIYATESIVVSGSSANGRFVSSINSSTDSEIPANNLQIITPRITIAEGADISVSSQGKGAAGSLTIVADWLDLASGGSLNANTLSGKGGNINLEIANMLQLKDNSLISTNALNQGNGGNIKIDTDFVIVFPDSLITAEAIAGKGGNIQIQSQEIFAASTEQISASSQLGLNGEVNLSTFTNNLRNNLTKLPETVLQTKNKIVSQCHTGEQTGQGSFVYIGKGALTPSPLETNFDSNEFIIDWGSESTLAIYEIETQHSSKVVEATEWMVGDRGNLVLTAQNSASSFFPPYQHSCPFAS